MIQETFKENTKGMKHIWANTLDEDSLVKLKRKNEQSLIGWLGT